MKGRIIAVAAALVVAWCGVLAGAGTAQAAPPDLIVFGRGLDDGVWYRTRDAGRWSGWRSIGEIVTDRPTAIRYPDGRVAVFGRGRDGALWTNETADGVSWAGWRSLRGVGTGAAVVARNRFGWPPGYYDVYAAVIGGDGRLWVNRLPSEVGAWSGWQGATRGTLSGHLVASPNGASVWAVGVGPGGHVVSTGISADGVPGDGVVWSVEVVGSDFGLVDGRVAGRAPSGELQTSESPSEIRSWGGLLTSAQIRGVGGDDMIVARGADGAIWSVGCCGQGWHSLGGYTLEVPSYGDAASGGILAARGSDLAVWIRETAGTTFGRWTSLGGGFKDASVVLGAS